MCNLLLLNESGQPPARGEVRSNVPKPALIVPTLCARLYTQVYSRPSFWQGLWNSLLRYVYNDESSAWEP